MHRRLGTIASSQRRWHAPFRRQRRASTASISTLRTDPSLVDDRHAPIDWEPSAAVVYPNVCTEDEAEHLTTTILSRLKRRRYEKGHWDSVIAQYKEIELEKEHNITDESSVIHAIFQRLRQHLQQHHLSHKPAESLAWLPCHAIDLKRDGELNAHVDSIKFSGDLVAGLSLLSPSIMQLKPDETQLLDEEAAAVTDDNLPCINLYLPPLSLYALTGPARYRYTHELLPSDSIFTNPINGETISVERDHRLSIIFRDSK